MVAVLAIAVLAPLIQSSPALASVVHQTLYQEDQCVPTVGTQVGTAKVTRDEKSVRVHVAGSMPAGHQFDIAVYNSTGGGCTYAAPVKGPYVVPGTGQFSQSAKFKVRTSIKQVVVAAYDLTNTADTAESLSFKLKP